MRQWMRTLALGTALTMVIAAPAAANGGDFDDAPRGTNDPVAQRVMEQSRDRLGAPVPVAPASVGDEMRGQDRARDRAQVGEGPLADCTGDGGRVTERAMEMERLRERIRDARDGCEAGWMLANCHAWAHQVAL